MRSNLVPRWYCLFLLTFFAVSCSLNQGLKKPQGEKDFLEQTSYLERVARYHPDLSVRAKSHLDLAFLYVNSRNPQLNYSRALREMESYLSLSPPKTQKDDFQNWLTVLRELDLLNKYRTEMGEQNRRLQAQVDKSQAGLEKLRIEMEKQNQNLQAEIDKSQAGLEKVRKANLYLRDEVASLKETNNKLMEIIEKLKILDQEMEERRGFVK